MASKVLALLSLVLLLGTYGAAQTSQGCVWTAVAPNCDDVRCPPETVEVTRGTSGICPKVVPEQICNRGQKKLCCPRTLQLRNCEWSGSAPFCTSICSQGKTKLAKDSWGGGFRCVGGCKGFCCEVLS